jgi:SAM-dependent methyltransferase
VQATFRSAAARLHADLSQGRVTPATFGAALAEIAPRDRDPWLDLLWNIEELPQDEPDLPQGCVPYLPCPVASVLEALEQANVIREDVFVDVGSGLGRAVLLAHLASGASCIGLEIQATLVRAARERADRLGLMQLQFLQGDAADLVRAITVGTVFFLYCPFGGNRLQRFLDGLERIARVGPIRVCCVDMPPLEARWLNRMPSTSSLVDVYRSR